MTKGQCRTAISQNQQNIRQYNSQIAQLKNDIDELNRVKGKIVELQNTLADCKGASKAKLDSTTGLNNVSHKILSGIYDGMGNLLTGHPYTKVHNGLESAITTITNEIAKKQAQISDLNSSINNCNTQINNMNSEINMAGTELIIDDDYVNEMADFLNTRAANLQEGIDRYIQILENIRRDAIKQGATADALDTFISYAKNLSNVVEELGQTAKETCNTFISDVDESDEFLF